MSVFLIMVLPSASGTAMNTTAKKVFPTPSNISQGVKATFNTVNPTYTSSTSSSVSYSVTVTFADGDWVQLGYIKGWVRPTPQSAWVLCSTPTLYVEKGFLAEWPPNAVVSTIRMFGTVSVGSTHTYDIHWTGTSEYYSLWSCYVDGVQIYNAELEPDKLYTYDVEVQGESWDSNDYSASHVYFNSLKYGKWVFPKRSPAVFQWYGWPSGCEEEVTGDWHAVFGLASMECWLT